MKISKSQIQDYLNWKDEIYVWDYFSHNGTKEEAYIVESIGF
jgi:hypothetical protein